MDKTSAAATAAASVGVLSAVVEGADCAGTGIPSRLPLKEASPEAAGPAESKGASLVVSYELSQTSSSSSSPRDSSEDAVDTDIGVLGSLSAEMLSEAPAAACDFGAGGELSTELVPSALA